MCLIQIKHAQIKFPLFSFWTVRGGREVTVIYICLGLRESWPGQRAGEARLRPNQMTNIVICITYNKDRNRVGLSKVKAYDSINIHVEGGLLMSGLA